MSYAQLQAVLQQVRELAGQVSSAASSLHPVSSLPAADEDRVGQELRRKLSVAEELHQYLARLVAQGEGLSAPALAQFHQRFIRLQQSQFDIARSEIVQGAQLVAGEAQITQHSKQLSDKIAQLIHMISEAAKQAQTHESHADASAKAAAAAAAAASSSSADAQLKQLADDKRALEKQLATLQRQVTVEKASRLKAEKAVEKHEQRWQALNEKVAEKKKAQLAAAVAGASAATAAASGASPTEISSASSAAAAASAASASSASGSLAKPPTARSVSTPSAPVSLHAARPVQLR